METMEARGDLRSIPVVPRGGALLWPAAVQEQMRALSLGPVVSRAASNAPQGLRQALAIPALPARAAEGFALFFDDLLSRDWFAHVLPCLALHLPRLLEDHYAGAQGSQAAGAVLLGQELPAVLFRLFPTASRREARPPSGHQF